MFFLRNRFWPLALMAVATATHAFALPQNGSILRLVPPGVQIVAGIEDTQNETSHGRLLLITHNNQLDWADAVALSGVDVHRVVSEVIEMATSSQRGELRDHMLLVAGHFHRNSIFRSATLNGAATGDYNGETVLIIKPFAREEQEMVDTRWMAIPDDKTMIFGTPELVQKALDRFVSHASPDEVLLGRLAHLHQDVDSWNVLALSAPMLAKHVAQEETDAAWTFLLDHADVLTLSIHYGATARLDFAIHAVNDADASLIANSLSTPQFVPVSTFEKYKLQLQNVSVRQDLVQASIVIPGKQFAAWLESVYLRRPVTVAAR
jgi:hypothetical protein